MKFRNLAFIIMVFCFALSNDLRADSSPIAKVAPTSTIIELDQNNIQSTLDSSHFLVVDVFANWCGPCKRMGPIFHELSAEYGTQYQFAKVNADANEPFVERFHIEGLPTILFFKDGKEIGRHVGFMNKDAFLKIKENFK